jgi:hypothetical protein
VCLACALFLSTHCFRLISFALFLVPCNCNLDGAPLKISDHCACVSSWSNETVSRAIRSTIPADASDPEPRQFTSWLGESSGERGEGRGAADSIGS